MLGSLFRIPLQNIAGDEVLGIFTLIYPLYMVALIISVAGIPLAISKLISEAYSHGNERDIQSIYQTACIMAIGFGVTGFLVLTLFSEPIAILLGNSEMQSAIIVVAITLVIAPYMALHRGYFQSYGDMRPTAISQTIEQFVRVGIILIAAIYFTRIGASSIKISTWVMTGSSIGAFTSLVYLRQVFTRTDLKNKAKQPFRMEVFKYWSKRITKVSIPLAIGTLTMALLNLVGSLTIPSSLHWYKSHQTNVSELYGIYGRGLLIIQIGTVFSTSILLPLVPAVSFWIVKNNHKQAAKVIKQSEALNQLISWPTAIGFSSLAVPLNLALFGDLQGSFVFALLGFSFLVISLLHCFSEHQLL